MADVQPILDMQSITKTFPGVKALAASLFSFVVLPTACLAGDTNVFELNTGNAEFVFKLQSCDESSATMRAAVTHRGDETKPAENWKAIKLAAGEPFCAASFKTFVREGLLISERGSVLFRVNQVGPFQYDSYDSVVTARLAFGAGCFLQTRGLSSTDQKCLILTRAPQDCANAGELRYEGHVAVYEGMLLSSAGAVVFGEKFRDPLLRFLEFLGLNDFRVCDG